MQVAPRAQQSALDERLKKAEEKAAIRSVTALFEHIVPLLLGVDVRCPFARLAYAREALLAYRDGRTCSDGRTFQHHVATWLPRPGSRPLQSLDGIAPLAHALESYWCDEFSEVRPKVRAQLPFERAVSHFTACMPALCAGTDVGARVQATFTQLCSIARTDASTVAATYNSAFWEIATRHFHEELDASNASAGATIVRVGLRIEWSSELHVTLQEDFRARAAVGGGEADEAARRAACLDLVQERMFLWA